MIEQLSFYPCIIEFPVPLTTTRTKGLTTAQPKRKVIYSRYDFPEGEFFKIIKSDATPEECQAVEGKWPSFRELNRTMNERR
jgi:hypothetical protein